MTACLDRIEGAHVAARIGDDLPGPYGCAKPHGHDASHGVTVTTASGECARVWWWTWGNGRLQVRAVWLTP